MKYDRFLFSNFPPFDARRYCVLVILCLLGWLSFNAPVLADGGNGGDGGFYPEQVFGKPEDFLAKFRDDTKTNLDSYLGTGIAITGFILVVRALIK